jgi:hypothetical protein
MTTNSITAKIGPESQTCFDVSGRFISDDTDQTRTFAERLSERAYFLYLDSAAVHGHDATIGCSRSSKFKRATCEKR